MEKKKDIKARIGYTKDNPMDMIGKWCADCMHCNQDSVITKCRIWDMRVSYFGTCKDWSR
jgi:hypothetical protein